MESYNHLITINKNTSVLEIHRVLSDGQKEFLTSIDLTSISAQSDYAKYENLAKNMGETILMDSPIARTILEL